MESTVHHETRSVILRKLFISTFYLSAFTFGGGYFDENKICRPVSLDR